MARSMTPIQKIVACLESGTNFVLQGGAGSGKTETLKQLLEHISGKYPEKSVACITHTNLAVDEIKSRVEGDFTISTIHSFLNSVIADYKKNIRSVISEIFKVRPFVEGVLADFDGDEKLFRQNEHNNYKKTYNNYAAKLWAVKKERSPKVTGKREYDSDPASLNAALNAQVHDLNSFIEAEILTKDYNLIKYNDTSFDDYKDLTYGHDSLLLISFLLFKKYPSLGKIMQDKFDFIFIDEYQDTNPQIVEIFLTLLPSQTQTIVGLFGDSMQAIYEDGVGDVEDYISSGVLIKIEKEDNYRCSPPVIKFINKLRNDGLRQNMAFKNIKGGGVETESDRLGSVSLVYAISDSRPHTQSSKEEKDAYTVLLNSLISKADLDDLNFRHLKLTNRSISTDVGFKYLYDIFAERYFDPKDSIDKVLKRIQLKELYDLCVAFEEKKYNLVLSSLKKHGYSIKTLSDKTAVAQKFDQIFQFSGSAIGAIEKAFEVGLLKKSEAFSDYVYRKDSFLAELLENPNYESFKTLYNNGENTFVKVKKINSSLDEDDFNDLEADLKQERFYKKLFSKELELTEIFQYLKYIEEKTKFITMHKTKGSGIDNVLVVLEEYFWNEYDFKSIYSDADDAKSARKKEKNLKLTYVACSRAKHNLTCVKLITSEEEAAIISLFEGANIQKFQLGQISIPDLPAAN